MRSAAELVRTCLRRDPAKRPTVFDLARDLAALAPDLEGFAWPVELPPA